METAVVPKTVVKHFIMNYFQVLHDTPEQLHKFYQEDSVYCVGTEGVAHPDDKVVGPEVCFFYLGSPFNISNPPLSFVSDDLLS